jgi:hypothetical protein
MIGIRTMTEMPKTCEECMEIFERRMERDD